MTILRIFIQDFDLQLDSLMVEWLLFGDTGLVLKQGDNALSDLPMADNTEVVIPADWVSFTPATLPPGNRKRVFDALPYLIEDHLMASPETVHVVVSDNLQYTKSAFVSALKNSYIKENAVDVSAVEDSAVEDSSAKNSTILASIDKQKLSDVLKLLKQHDIYPNRLLPATLIAKLAPNSWSFICDKQTIFVRTAQNNGLALMFDDENTTQQLPPLALQLAINQANDAQTAPKEIFVYGNLGDEKVTLDLANWTSQLGIPFVQKNSVWKSTAPLTNLKAGMNFLQGPFGPANQGWAALTQAKPALWLACLMVLISLVGSGVDWAHKSLQKNRLDKAMKTLFISTFPDATNVVDAPLQMQRKLSEMQHASGVTEGNDFLPLLAKVSERTGGLANVSAIDYIANQLTLSLQANSEDAARSLVQKISIPGQIINIQNLKTANNAVTYQLVFKAVQ